MHKNSSRLPSINVSGSKNALFRIYDRILRIDHSLVAWCKQDLPCDKTLHHPHFPQQCTLHKLYIIRPRYAFHARNRLRRLILNTVPSHQPQLIRSIQKRPQKPCHQPPRIPTPKLHMTLQKIVSITKSWRFRSFRNLSSWEYLIGYPYLVEKLNSYHKSQVSHAHPQLNHTAPSSKVPRHRRQIDLVWDWSSSRFSIQVVRCESCRCCGRAICSLQ